MPWSDRTLPNAMLKVTEACNLSCRVCYHRKSALVKPFADVMEELETAMKLRPLHTVTISGGEPTLHPRLCDIVRMGKRHGLHVFLLTNGVLIDRRRLEDLRDAGLDSILFHVDRGQRRPDLPENASFRDVAARVSGLCSLAASCRLDASMSYTLYDGTSSEITDVCDLFFGAPFMTMLFLSRGAEPGIPAAHVGAGPAASTGRGAGSVNTEIVQGAIDIMRKEYGIIPFAYVPGTDGVHTLWVSYFVPVAYGARGPSLFPFRSTSLDAWTMRVPRVLTGRFIHKTVQCAPLTLVRTVMNGVATFRPGPLLRFIGALARRGASLRHKTIVYDHGPTMLPDGRVVRCLYCPTAVVQNGRLRASCFWGGAPAGKETMR